MTASTPTGILQLITSAVTPVVMISAAAILIGGINTKHASLSDRVRSLSAEYRSESTPEDRKTSIRIQVAIFLRRAHYVAAAHFLLHAAVIAFILVVLSIVVGSTRPTWSRLALGEFIAGVVMMLGAVVLELLDLRLSDHTLRLDAKDVVRRRSGEVSE